MLTKGKASKVTAWDASPKLLTDIVEGRAAREVFEAP